MEADTYCKITGDPVCKCKRVEGKTIVNFEDFRVTMRRIFTDHAVYTSLLIIQSVPKLEPDADITAKRLLENPVHLRAVLQPFLGPAAGQQVENLFSQHLKIAASALGPARMGNQREITAKVNELLEQGKEVGKLLGSINPIKLSPATAIAEFTTHNQYVAKLATLRSQRKYQEYIDTYDDYFNHMMALSDTVTMALPRSC